MDVLAPRRSLPTVSVAAAAWKARLFILMAIYTVLYSNLVQYRDWGGEYSLQGSRICTLSVQYNSDQDLALSSFHEA